MKKIAAKLGLIDADGTRTIARVFDKFDVLQLQLDKGIQLAAAQMEQHDQEIDEARAAFEKLEREKTEAKQTLLTHKSRAEVLRANIRKMTAAQL